MSGQSHHGECLFCSDELMQSFGELAWIESTALSIQDEEVIATFPRHLRQRTGLFLQQSGERTPLGQPLMQPAALTHRGSACLTYFEICPAVANHTPGLDFIWTISDSSCAMGA